jgi:hypothetical protein
MRKPIIAVCTLSLAAAGAIFACSEAAPPLSATDASAPPSGDSGATDSAIARDAIAPSVDAGACGLANADAAALPLVVNEIRAKGKEFVELYNPTSTTVDLGGAKLVDVEPDGGCPKFSSAVIFPAGTKVTAGAYVVVFTGQADAGVGPSAACFDAGVSSCFYATYGLSNSAGDTVLLTTASDGVVALGTYPPSAVDAGESWGRLPNATGDFTKNTPTPGASNKP